MFFSQDILQKRGGKFGKIWLAATKMSKLSRREVASISIIKSCDEILEYVERRMVPREVGGVRPRFSLYLSALLMYGCVRIHQKQLEYLLADASTMFVRVTSVANLVKGSEIDLNTEMRAELVTIPEVHMVPTEEQFDLDLDFHFLTDEELSELLGRPNPEFWRMETSSASLSPRPLSISTIPESPKRLPAEPVIPDIGSPHTVKSIEDITLKEVPSILLSPEIQRPWDKDWMLDGQDLDLIVGQQLDEPRLTVEDLLPTSTPLPATQDGASRGRTRQQTVESPIPVVTGEMVERTPPRHPPLEIPEHRAVPPSPGVTQQIITSPLPRRQMRPELELTAQTPSPARQRRKRQLAFADAETQIPKSMMKKNLTTGRDTCENFVLQELGPRSAADLLNLPGRQEWRQPPFLNLFKRTALTRASSDTESEISEISEMQSPTQDQQLAVPEVPIEPMQPDIAMQVETLPQVPVSPVLPAPAPPKRPRRRATVDESIEEMRKITSIAEESVSEGIEQQSMELGRDLSTSRLGTSDRQAEIPDITVELEDSRQEKDSSARKKRKTRSTASSVEEEQDLASISSLQASRIQGPTDSRSLYDIHEELEPGVPAIEPQPPILPETALVEGLEDKTKAAETLLRCIDEEVTQGHGRVTFQKICPPQTETRKTAAKVFSLLLELCSQKKVAVRQTEAFGEIEIVV